MDKRIVKCRIENGGFMKYIMAKFDDGSEMIIANYYPDELSFEPDEFIGLTMYEARDLYHKRDVAFLKR